MNYCAFHDLIDWSEYHAGGALDAELWCAMLLRALGYGSELGSSTARTALRIGLISRPLEGTLTRGDLFETALAALTYPAKDGGTLLDGLLAKGLCTAAAVEALGLRRETLTARRGRRPPTSPPFSALTFSRTRRPSRPMNRPPTPAPSSSRRTVLP